MPGNRVLYDIENDPAEYNGCVKYIARQKIFQTCTGDKSQESQPSGKPRKRQQDSINTKSRCHEDLRRVVLRRVYTRHLRERYKEPAIIEKV